MKKNFLSNIFFKECVEYNLGLWQCPSFLFIVMGILNICSILVVYIVVRGSESPELVIISVSAVSILIFSVGVSVIKTVEQIANLNRIKSEFISIASHQLKAPLSGMRWSLDLLLGNRCGSLNGKQEEYLKDIQENISRLARLINDLLDVSKIESGKMNMNMQEVDLKEVINSVAKEFDFFAKANNSEIILKINKEDGKVKTDSVRIRMVVENFVDNAIKYIGGKHGKIEIGLKNYGEFVQCSVKDNGIGISKEDQKKIFEKFFRGSAVVKKQTIGTGLGLYIAKAAIESSGGKIGFISEEGKGSTFWFALPKKV